MTDDVKLYSQRDEYKAGRTHGYYDVLPGERTSQGWPDSVGRNDADSDSCILFRAGYLDGRIAGVSRDPTRHDVLMRLLANGMLSAHTDEHVEIAIACHCVSLAPFPASGHRAGQNLPGVDQEESAPRDSGATMSAVQIVLAKDVCEADGPITLEDALMHMGLGVS